MAHFARIDGDNRVIAVVVAEQEYIDSGLMGDPADWVQYSYNTHGGVHYEPDTVRGDTENVSEDQSLALRYNAAHVGGYYDPDADAFYSVAPYASWELDTETYLWVPPADAPPKPEGDYKWDEETHGWIWGGDADKDPANL
jgi:hypothetical protein